MSTNVIAIFGKSCCAKSDVARELSRMTGNKVKHPGEAVTSRAKALKLSSGKEVTDDWLREVDADTVRVVDALEELWIIESGLLDAVLGAREDVFFVELTSREEVREARWHKRREEGGGRTRQIGDSLARRDADDTALRARLYPHAEAPEPAIRIDTSEHAITECARQILAAFQSQTGVTLAVAKAEMDKGERRGIAPGPSDGTVRSYTPERPPFGGYITDERSGKDLYVHKSAVEEADIGEFGPGQKIAYDVVEDGFGGFKAAKLRNP
jgi:cold shock CspA family protein/cytidylate kinase